MVQNGQMGQEIVVNQRAKMLKLIKDAEEQQRIYAEEQQRIIQEAKPIRKSSRKSEKDAIKKKSSEKVANKKKKSSRKTEKKRFRPALL